MKKMFIVFAILALSFTLVACGSSDTPAPANQPAEQPAAEQPAAEQPAAKTYVAADPEKQPLVDTIVPNLRNKVKSGDITQERMDEIVGKAGTGELTLEQIQAIMMGQPTN